MPSTSNKLFVSVPSDSTRGLIIFGVNSFRPNGEVEEVVYLSAMDNSADSVIKVCRVYFLTFIRRSKCICLSEHITNAIVISPFDFLTVQLFILSMNLSLLW